MSNQPYGYGNPPDEYKYKKGVCPNPKGRTKREPLNLREVIERVFATRVDIQIRGKLRRIALNEAMVKSLVASAVNGDVNAADELLKLRLRAKSTSELGPRIITLITSLADKETWTPLPNTRT